MDGAFGSRAVAVLAVMLAVLVIAAVFGARLGDNTIGASAALGLVAGAILVLQLAGEG
jgi:hypothetical protein